MVRTKGQPKKKALPEETKKSDRVTYDSDDSEYFKPSMIIKRIKEEEAKEAQERAKAHEKSQETEKLAFYPSVWLSLGMVAASKHYVKDMDDAEKIYTHVHGSMIDLGVIDSDNDPENDDFEDPLVLDTCQVCGKPHDNGDEGTNGWKNALISCYVEHDDKSTFGCRKWFHVGCVGRTEIPKGDWCCYECSKKLDLSDHDTKAHDMRGGVEFQVDDVDEGFDADEAKKAAKKDKEEIIGDDADDIVDDDAKDRSEDEETSANVEEENDDPLAGSGEDDDKDDEDYADTQNNVITSSNDESEDYNADTEDENCSSDKRRKAGKKRCAESQKSPAAKSPAAKSPAAKSPAAKKKKTGDRVTGQKPENPKQLFDFIVRKKLKACKGTMATLQHMSLPIKRSDEYEAPDDSDDEPQEIVDQQGWPWMIHALSCYTEAKPNEDGGKNGTFLKKPEYHTWVGSEQAAKKQRLAFAPVTDMKVIVHTSFDDYFNAMRSESAKSKDPPPRAEKAIKTKNKPYGKKWINRNK